MTDFSAIEEKLAYSFVNKDALIRAFTHGSYTNENKGCVSYERQEFLGDAFLDLVISEYLYQKHPEKNEGEMTVLRAKLVDEYALNEIGLYLDFDSMIRFLPQKYHKNEVSESMRADVVEALIATIFLESGYNKAKSVIIHLYSQVFQGRKDWLKEQRNYKSELQEYYQKKYHKLTISYKVYKVKGPSWDCIFYMYCLDGDRVIGSGRGTSKKEASQMAAKNALENIRAQDEQI